MNSSPFLINGNPVFPRISSRAKQLSLRAKHNKAYVEVVIPKNYKHSLHHISQFLKEQHLWIKNQYNTFSPNIPFVDQLLITVEDVPLTIQHLPHSHAVPSISEHKLLVGGKAEHLERRVKDFLKKRARSRLLDAVSHFSQKLHISFHGSIRIVDTPSQWGSCQAHSQKLSFNWRLILAPSFVCDHVAAHEVAHISILNHSKEFYSLLNSLDPHTPKARTWLKQNGHSLFAYARDSR